METGCFLGQHYSFFLPRWGGSKVYINIYIYIYLSPSTLPLSMDLFIQRISAQNRKEKGGGGEVGHIRPRPLGWAVGGGLHTKGVAEDSEQGKKEKEA